MIHRKLRHSLRMQGFVLSSLLGHAATQSSSASFLYPDPASAVLTINAYDSLHVKWISNYDQAFLHLWCDDDSGTGGQKDWLSAEVSTTGNLAYSPWQGLNRSRDWSIPIECHFDIAWLEGGKNIQQGPLLSITSDMNSAPTVYNQAFTSLMAPTTTAMTTTSMSFSSTAASSPTSSATTARDNGTVSDGAIAGAASGAVFAVAVLMTTGYFFFRYHRRIKELEASISRSHATEGHVFQRPRSALAAKKYDRSQAELSELVA